MSKIDYNGCAADVAAQFLKFAEDETVALRLLEEIVTMEPRSHAVIAQIVLLLCDDDRGVGGTWGIGLDQFIELIEGFTPPKKERTRRMSW